MLFKKLTVITIVTSLMVSLVSPCYAAEFNPTENSTPNLQLISENQENILTFSEMEQNVQRAIENGTIDREYADKLLAIIEKHADSYLEVESRLSDYYNPDTGAVIKFIPLPTDPTRSHGMVMMNKEGFEIVKDILAIGGGAVGVGGGLLNLTGSALVGPIASAIGGALIIEAGALSLQFSLGKEYAYCMY